MILNLSFLVFALFYLSWLTNEVFRVIQLQKLFKELLADTHFLPSISPLGIEKGNKNRPIINAHPNPSALLFSFPPPPL